MRIRLLVPALFLLLTSSCSTLPPRPEYPVSHAFDDTSDSALTQSLNQRLARHPGKDGFLLLESGLDAFVARAALASYARRSIDVQYYLYHRDEVGSVFTALLLEAADRGVRVRILVDDMDMGGRDEAIIAFDSHPNIEIRLFNPFSRKTWRGFQFLTGLGTLTRRMHNKSFIVDNAAAILGGRNIGNEYFDANPELTFTDLDVLAIGPVVRQASASFDRYWNSTHAWPVTAVIDARPGESDKQNLLRTLKQRIASNHVNAWLQSLDNAPLARQIRQGETWDWGQAVLVVDEPEKIAAARDANELHLASQLEPFFADLHEELLIVSPYFVPGREGVDFFRQLRERGIRVKILTNSLASSDVGIVHAGYMRYREALLKLGVELYEMNKLMDTKPRGKSSGTHGSSRASLHAKTFVLDRQQTFIGSLNLDPRSLYENTEIGLVIDSPAVATEIARQFDQLVKQNAFRLELYTDEDDNELIRWHGYEAGRPVTWEVEPHSSLWQRLGVSLLMLLPIESQL